MSKLHDAIGETYKVIRGYLNSEEAIQVGKNFKQRVKEKGLSNDAVGFVDNCVSEYNSPELSAILSEKTVVLNELLGKKVIPSYCFTRMSYTGSSLPRHKDRPSCEISLSIHLLGDTPWAFGIVNSQGDDVEVILEPGDAILYDAPNATHFRSEYTGEYYVQSFHHYVYLEGEFSNMAFDGGLRRDLDTRNYIKHYPKALPAHFCEDVINFVNSPTNASRWDQSDTVNYTEGVRTCTELVLKEYDYIDDIIYFYVKKYIDEYANEVPFFTCKKDSGYTVLRYGKGNEFKYHTDQCLEYNRASTMIINLNDDYVGGQLNFHNDLVSYELGKGDVVIFPSSYAYPHKINPISDGVRYSIVTWLV